MWLPIFLSVAVYVSAEIIQDSLVFHKCCPKNQSLLKVSDAEGSSGEFQCIDRDSAKTNYNLYISPLILGENLKTQYGIPTECNEIKMDQIILPQLNKQAEELNDYCYDRLVIEVVNFTKKAYIPKIVVLSCVKDEVKDVSQIKVLVNHLRKCCPSGQSYDSNYHLCRKSVENTEDWLVKRLNHLTDNNVYEVDIGLNCKPDEYGVELKEDFFSLKLQGNNLKAMSRNDEGVHHIPSGEWCVDGEHEGQGLVARVCSRDCAKYGAFCVRKCCPIGHHYRPRRCGSFRSQCVPNEDDVLFDIEDYIEPLIVKDDHIVDVMGIRTELLCPEGRVVLNKSLARDRHSLDMKGRLVSPISTGYDYCFEAFDLRMCPSNEIIITAVNCFIKGPVTKDFQISFILISISSVCLGLTLVVYLSLPELRNLHGRTLICHTGTMLLAFSCLARVQYGPVPNNNICTSLGYGIYFGFVAAFAWLNVMCFDIWWTFGSVRTVHPMRKTNAELRRFLWYSLYAWGYAILMTLITYLFDKFPVSAFLDSNIGEGVCWFGTVQNSQSDWPHYIFFVIPLGIVTGTNFVLWVLTARHCARVKSEVHRLQAGSVGDRAKRRFRLDRAKYVLTGKLWVVMGAGWISELLSTVASEPRWLWTIIDLINELQGVFIFLILVIKPKLYYLLRKRLGLEKPDAQKNATSSSGRTSSTFLSRALSSEDRNTRLSLQNNVKT